MKKNILFLLINFLFISVSALSQDECDYSDISRMKSIVTNINISYDYRIINNQAYFDVTLTNITEDIYFYDTKKQKKYFYSDTNDGEITIYDYSITSGSYKFYSAKSGCYGTSLGVKYYNFPVYNRYYGDPLCEDIPNYSLCQKWENINYSRDEFERFVLEYKSSKEIVEEEKIEVEHKKTILEKIVDTIVDIYVKYYYYFLGVLIFICVTVIIIKNKKNKFDL